MCTQGCETKIIPLSCPVPTQLHRAWSHCVRIYIVGWDAHSPRILCHDSIKHDRSDRHPEGGPYLLAISY